MSLEQILEQTIEKATPLIQASIQALGVVYAGLVVAFFFLVERFERVLETRKSFLGTLGLVGLYIAFGVATINVGIAVIVDAQALGLTVRKIEAMIPPGTDLNLSQELPKELPKMFDSLESANQTAAFTVLILLLYCVIGSLGLSMYRLGWLKKWLSGRRGRRGKSS